MKLKTILIALSTVFVLGACGNNTASSSQASKGSESEQLRTNWIYFAAAQYAPIQGQDLRFYVAYVGNTLSYDKALHLKDEQLHRIAIGAYYTLPILKSSH